MIFLLSVFLPTPDILDSSVHPYSTQVRLVESWTGYASSGYLEIFLGGSWGPVCNMYVTDAYAACRQLGYTKAAAYLTALT